MIRPESGKKLFNRYGLQAFIALALLLTTPFALAAETAQARVYFIAPQDGQVIEGSVHVVMGLSGMGVAPAGVDRANTGHHHLIINAPTPAAGLPIPSDENHLHFGGGQTEAKLELPPGQHTLQLVIGDLAHRPHEQPVVSDVIRITVK